MMRSISLTFIIGTSFPNPEDAKPDEANYEDGAEDDCNQKEERH